MNCIIFTGGNYPEKSEIMHFIEPLQSNSIIIAADSGMNAAMAYDMKPDFFLGDMDSVKPEAVAWFKSFEGSDKTSKTTKGAPHAAAHQKPQNIETFPQDKDFSDTELAIYKAKSLGADFIVLIGGSGGRLDHLLGILELFKGRNKPDLWLAEENAVIFTDTARRSSLSISGLAEDAPVSVFPVFQPDCTDKADKEYSCKSENLVWPLDGLDWQGGAISLSNRRKPSTDKDGKDMPVRLNIQKGSFIVILPLSASFSFSA